MIFRVGLCGIHVGIWRSPITRRPKGPKGGPRRHGCVHRVALPPASCAPDANEAIATGKAAHPTRPDVPAIVYVLTRDAPGVI